MAQAILSIISDFGNRAENINRAVWDIESYDNTHVTLVSRIYETNLDKPSIESDNLFVAVISVETEFDPYELLEKIKTTEINFGRTTKSDAPQVLDIDILDFEGAGIDDERLSIPHKLLTSRPYILAAYLNIFSNKEYKDRLRELGEDNIKVTGEGLYLPL